MWTAASGGFIVPGSLHLLALVLALILFVLAAFGVPSRVGLGWLGLAFLTLAGLGG